MTRVDFYHNADSRLETAARIVRKAYHQGVPALVYAPEPALARELDQLLWVTPSGSFLPHCGADDPLAGETPVVIAAELASDCAPPTDKLLINLGDEVPPGFARFQRQRLRRHFDACGACLHAELHGLSGGVAQGELGTERIAFAHQRR